THSMPTRPPERGARGTLVLGGFDAWEACALVASCSDSQSILQRTRESRHWPARRSHNQTGEWVI
ncbi:MAG TPA: hypothetical protein VGN73_07620, partial [Gemmatimonadaceae bacterium]|nr:hypothetical protein [Gemmatimonadaceae bacterium]